VLESANGAALKSCAEPIQKKSCEKDLAKKGEKREEVAAYNPYALQKQ
jgi:hypothetical protein